MTVTRKWLAISALLVASVLATSVLCRFALARQPIAPRLVAIQTGSAISCGAVFAIDSGGTFYMDCGLTGHFVPAGSVPGVPVSMALVVNTRDIWVGTESGDVFVTNTQGSPPYTFTKSGNVFTP
jgi:hypothetical protein